jgi:hypothetical protein
MNRLFIAGAVFAVLAAWTGSAHAVEVQSSTIPATCANRMIIEVRNNTPKPASWGIVYGANIGYQSFALQPGERKSLFFNTLVSSAAYQAIANVQVLNTQGVPVYLQCTADIPVVNGCPGKPIHGVFAFTQLLGDVPPICKVWVNKQ